MELGRKFRVGITARVVAVTALVFALAVGCGGGDTIGGNQNGGTDGGGDTATFTFGRGADSIGFDPVNVTDGESLKVARQIYDRLLDFAPGSTELVPSLATEVPEAEEDGTVYTFNLREGVEFHDGEPFNAEAVVFNFERWQNEDNEYHVGGGGQSSGFAYYANMFGGFGDESVIESVEAVDEYTVRFTLREPQGPFLRNIAMSPFAIASPAAVREDAENFWRNPVGTGPFTFESWNQGSEVRLAANEDWWGSDLPEDQGGGGPFVDTVVFRSIEDNTARVASLSGGDLSAADGLTPDDVPTIEDTDGLKVESRPPLNVGYIAMNTQKEPFDDPRVRQAMTLAVDMEEIVQGFFGDTADVAKNPMPPTVPFYRDDTEPYTYDPDEARLLLEEAGLADGFDTNLWHMPIPRPYMPDGQGVAQAIQQDLQEVGINASLETREWGTYLEEVARGTHDMAMLGWTGDNGDPDNFLNVHFNSSNATEEDASNIAYYENPEVDELLEQGATTTDEAEREEAYFRVQEILREETPWMLVAYAEPPLGFQEPVEGYVPSPTGGESFNTVEIGQ